MMKSIRYSLSGINQVARELLSSLSTKCVVLIEGEMGVGKTTLMSALLSMFGIQDVSSPTYSIVNEYLSDQGKRIHHYDLYRVKDVDELYEMGFIDLLENADWHFIEWPAVGAPFYPANAIHWKIEVLANQDRMISITSE